MIRKPIKEVCTFLPKSKIRAGQGKEIGQYPFFTSSDVQKLYLDDYLHDGEGIIIGTGGKPSCNYCSGKFAVSTDNFVLQTKSTLFGKYLYYFLRHNNLSILEKGFRGAGLKHIGKKYLESIMVPVKDLSEQRSVVATLDKINDLIDANKRQLELLDEAVKARFFEMFGDIEEPKKIFKIVKMGDVCEIGSSHRVFTNEFVEKGIPFYRGTEIGELSSGITPKNPFFISSEHYYRIANDNSKPKMGDILIPSICNKGQVWRVNTEEPFYYKDGRVLSISPNRNLFNTKYFECYFKYKSKVEYQKLGFGSTFAEFKIFILKEMDIICPPIQIQSSFAEFLELNEMLKVETKKNVEMMTHLLNKKMDDYFCGDSNA